MTSRWRFLLCVAGLSALLSIGVLATEEPPCNCQIGSADPSANTTCGSGTCCVVNESWFHCGDNFFPWLSNNRCDGMYTLKQNANQ